jgi:hypothetical protein
MPGLTGKFPHNASRGEEGFKFIPQIGNSWLAVLKFPDGAARELGLSPPEPAL